MVGDQGENGVVAGLVVDLVAGHEDGEVFLGGEPGNGERHRRGQPSNGERDGHQHRDCEHDLQAHLTGLREPEGRRHEQEHDSHGNVDPELHGRQGPDKAAPAHGGRGGRRVVAAVRMAEQRGRRQPDLWTRAWSACRPMGQFYESARMVTK